MKRYWRIALLMLLLLAAAVAVHVSGLGHLLSPAYLQQLIQSHPVSGLALYIGLFCLGNLLHLPGWIFLAGAVLALGKVWGGMATYAAAVLSCSVTYFLIRAIGGDALRVIHHRYVVSILRRLDSHPVSSISLLRVLCQTMPTVNYVLALSGVSFRHYLLGTLIGLPLPILLYCLLFDYLGRILGWQ